jgi:hypothetical protein
MKVALARNLVEKMMNDRSTILVTGCPRSGTTWLGKVLSAPSDIRYINEPFNVKNPHPSTSFRSRFSFEHLASTDHERLKHLENLFTGHGKIWALEKRGLKMKRQLKWFASELCRGTTTHTLIKDPIAFLSVETLAEKFKPQIVVMTRRPESIIASHLSRKWDFSNLEIYVKTMRPLNIWTDEQLDETLDCRDSPVDRLAHMWRLLALWQIQLRDRHPDWVFIRHEDLVRNPEQGFRNICTRLGLEFTGPRQDFLESSKSPSKGSDGIPKVRDVKRSQTQLIDADKALEPEQDRVVKAICREELGMLYPEILPRLITA